MIPTCTKLFCKMQAANEALLKLLQVPKAVPQHMPPQHAQHAQQPQQQLTHQQHQQLLQQQRLQQQARQLQESASQPISNQATHLQAASSGLGSQGLAQVPLGALQLQQRQQQAQANQLWQVRPVQVGALPGLPTGVSVLQPSLQQGLGVQGAHASLAPLAVEISAANLANLSQPLMAALSAHTNSRVGDARQQMPAASLPSFVLSGTPVSVPQTAPVSTSSAVQPESAPQ